MDEAIRLIALARAHYRSGGDQRAESRALTAAAMYYELAGQRHQAETFAQAAITVLGPDPLGADLARALEANAYLQTMAGNVAAVLDLVDRTLAAGGPAIEEPVLIRSLNHRGNAANVAGYPAGRSSLDEARDRAEAAGDWWEHTRALLNHAWAAAEAQDVPVASDYAQRAIASAIRHELPMVEGASKAQYARVLELMGRWDEAADLAREVLDGATISQLVARPILAAIDVRKGRPSVDAELARLWRMASAANEFQRLAPAAIAIAEHAWVSGRAVVPISDLHDIVWSGLERGMSWSSGKLASWLWRLGELPEPPTGIAEPYRMLMSGYSSEAATTWGARGIPTSAPWP